MKRTVLEQKDIISFDEEPTIKRLRDFFNSLPKEYDDYIIGMTVDYWSEISRVVLIHDEYDDGVKNDFFMFE